MTQAQYRGVMGVNRFHYSSTGNGKDAVRGLDTSEHPAENLSWFDAVDFCNQLSAKERLKPYYLREGETVALLGGVGYRLPTEAEWEYACRAGTITRWAFGDDEQVVLLHAWVNSDSGGRPHRVGELAANPFGLFDMHGNVWEWCWDWGGPYPTEAVSDPTGASGGSTRVFRGATFFLRPRDIRSGSRGFFTPSARLHDFGFRIARTIELKNRPSKTSPASPSLDGAGAQLLANAIAWYRAEGNADDSARKHNGRLERGAIVTPIDLGQAFNFNGAAASVVVPDAPELNPKSQFTVMAWTRPRQRAGDTAIISKMGGAAPEGYTFGFRPVNAALFVQFNAPGEPWAANELSIALPQPLAAREWTHVAGSYDGQSLHLYQDGKLLGSKRVGTKSIGSSGNFRISCDDNNPGVCFHGLIDDAAFFDRALTEAEIETIYRGTADGKGQRVR